VRVCVCECASALSAQRPGGERGRGAERRLKVGDRQTREAEHRASLTHQHKYQTPGVNVPFGASGDVATPVAFSLDIIYIIKLTQNN